MRSAGGLRKIGMTGLTSLACSLRLKQRGRPSASHPVSFSLFIRDANEGIGMTGLIAAQGKPPVDTLRFASDFACAAAPEQSDQVPARATSRFQPSRDCNRAIKEISG